MLQTQHDVINVEVISENNFNVDPYGFISKTTNAMGLLRIFNQFAIEAFSGLEFVPKGVYRVSRVKKPFRHAVYKVEKY